MSQIDSGLGWTLHQGNPAVADEETGILLTGSPRDKARRIRDLAEDRTLRERLRERGRAWVEEHFDARTNAAVLARRFEDVARGDGAVAADGSPTAG